MTRAQAYLYLGLLAALLIGASVAYSYRGVVFRAEPSVPPAQGPSLAPLTTEMQHVLDTTNGFQYLVSYTDDGFSPSALSVSEGETVRFTNNSGHDLWVTASGSPLYPLSQQGCGESALDSCGVLHPDEFWEFTFTAAGTWSYVNSMQKSDGGTVTVQ